MSLPPKISQPYPGLRPFERHESKIFFGREQQVDDLLARLKQRHFLAVLGASGSGKSSLVKAGLLPALAKGYMGEVGTRWSIAELRPGAQAFERLADALLQDDIFRRVWLPPGQAPAPQAQAFLTAALRRGARSLHEILAATPLPAGARLLLVIDQFEELFRYRSQDENQAAAFAALLLEATAHADIYVVITMRSDFLGHAAEFQGLPEAVNDGLYLTPRLTRQQLTEAITKPVRLFDGKIEDGLVNALCNEVGHDADQLPLLQHALMRLWQGSADKQPSLEAYRKLGGLQGALDGHAEEAWESLAALGPLENAVAAAEAKPVSEGQRIAILMFRALTERGSENRDIRRPANVGEILALIGDGTPTLLPAVVEAFSQTGRNFLMLSPPGGLTADSVLDISHESLIRQWQRLQDWVAAEAKKAALLKRLSDAAQRHRQTDRLGRRMGSLWQGTDLSLALEWRDDEKPTAAWAKRYLVSAPSLSQGLPGVQGLPCNDNSAIAKQALHSSADATQAPPPGLAEDAATAFEQAMAFLDESAAEEKRLADEKEADRQEKLQILQEAEQRLAKSLFDAKLTHASLLARIEDYAGANDLLRQTRELDSQIEASRRHARDLLAGFAAILGGDAAQTYRGAGVALIGNLVLSPDGHWLAAGGEQGKIALFERESGKLNLLQAEAGNAVDVYGVAFHPKQPWLYAGGTDGRIIRWQLPKDGQAAQILQSWQAGRVESLALSPDGEVLASGHGDGSIRLWQTGNGKPIHTLTGHTGLIGAGGLAFSPDGGTLASASYDGTARIWDWRNGKSLRELKGHTDDVHGVAFSLDGKLLATSSKDQSIRLWDVGTGQARQVLQGHSDKVYGLQFVAGGRLLASSSDDQTIRLWDLDTGVTMRVLQGHDAGVTGLAAAQPDKLETLLFSASKDGTLKRWPLDLTGQWSLRLPTEPNSAAVTPDGRQVVVGFADGNLRVYALPEAQTGQGLKLLHEKTTAHTKPIYHMAFDPSGKRLASAGFDKLAKLWRLDADGALTEEKTFAGHTDAVYSLAFSADGQHLATASYDGQIGLFDLHGDQKTLFPAHEGFISSVSFTPDGRALLSAGNEDRQLKFWNLASQPPQLSKTLPEASDKLMWASVSPDGRWLAAVGRGSTKVRLCPVLGEECFPLTGHQQTVYKALFSPDSRQLATVSMDTTVRFWDLDARAELFRLRLPTAFFTPSPVWDFDFRCTPTGCWVAVPLVRGVLAVYNLGQWH